MRPNLNICGCALTAAKAGKAANSAANAAPPDPRDLKGGFAAAEAVNKVIFALSAAIPNPSTSADGAAGSRSKAQSRWHTAPNADTSSRKIRLSLLKSPVASGDDR